MEKQRKNLSAASFDEIMRLVTIERANGWEVEYIITDKDGIYGAQLFRSTDNRHE